MRKIAFLVTVLFVLLLPVCATNKQSYIDYISSVLPSGSEIITDGVSHIKFYYGGNHINVFHINRDYNRSIAIEPLLPSEFIKGLKPLHYFNSTTRDYILILNCMYFNMQLGYPLGLLKIKDELYTGSIYNRSALIIYKDKYIISRVGMDIKVNNIVVDNLNQPRMSKNSLLMYTKRWGVTTPPTPTNGIQVKVDNNKVTNISTQIQQIPLDGYVLVGPKTRVSSLKVGNKVKTKIDTIPSFPTSDYIVSGGPTVLTNSNINILAKEEKMGYIGEGKYNRTFACITKDNSLVLATASGKGISLKDEVLIMKKFSCTDGMNFDGGTSTSGYYKKDNKVFNIVSTGRLLPVVLVVKTIDNY